ncbi:hypothetical protein [Clostridium sp.]|uniref:hypothetical protein n=1 Tax=Clostridium sp. TaxID=1506 RepID=UPI0026076507|nr:hypothetical protein [Clostridium sp.]
MLEINNKVIEEKIRQLKKAIEIVGGKEYLETFKDNNEIAKVILQISLQEKDKGFVINNKIFEIKELQKIKLNYEKNYIKNKKIYLEKIKYKIIKYNTFLESLIRKYKKSQGIEEYRKIKEEIEIRYKKDINNFLLYEIENYKYEDELYYGEYLQSKKEDFINSILSLIL